MSSSNQLRNNKNQHKVKNLESKLDDKCIKKAMQDVLIYLQEKFNKELEKLNLFLELRNKLKHEEIIYLIQRKHIRSEFINLGDSKTHLKPDGGIIFLLKKDDCKFKKIILISETKKQGTNDKRIKEGKKKQSTGNAIERYGKNLIGFKSLFNHERITPIVCFCWGCDIKDENNEYKYAAVKLNVLNEFYSLDRIFVFKRDGSSDKNSFSPTTFITKNKKFTKEEYFNILKEVAETSLRYYIF